MPYITPGARRQLNVKPFTAMSPGELNYVITKLVHNYVERSKAGLRYETLNEVIGILDCAKAEFYRTVVAPYEDEKRRVTGPISQLDAVP